MAMCKVAHPAVCVGTVDVEALEACTLCARAKLRDLWRAGLITWTEFRRRLHQLEPHRCGHAAGAVNN